ncbi:Protein T20B12.3 [Aphelenchoides avenae]|nr:Protein T20B12.3 [Aphelenchus avenae]
MPNGQLFGDFLFKLFDRGQIFSVLSLAGIFHLIIHHNFEYPDFYSVVYSLLNSYVCYSTYAQRFFELIDQFLRSSHVPNYIVASYVKRLARLLLTAPTALQSPIITLLRNVLSRHPDLTILVHRDSPTSLEADPYDETEKDLKKSNALESSLWELKAIKNHWHPSVSKKASAAETVVRTELETKWSTDEEIFERMFARKFGHELPEHGVIEEADEDSSDETELLPPKKKAKGIAFVEMQRRLPANKKGKNDVPSNFIEPPSSFLKSFPQGAINFDAVWKI